MLNYQTPLRVGTNSRNESEQVGRNDPFDEVSEGTAKMKARLELTETSSECS